MSTYSQAWHDTPPAIRDFYRNFHNRYLRQARRIDSTPPPGIDDWFSTFGWAFHAYSPAAIAMKNWTYQTFALGSFNPAIVVFATHSAWSDPSPGPPYGVTGLYSWSDQFIDIPNWATQYPRAKRKAPKTYWTGKPRRRRNL